MIKIFNAFQIVTIFAAMPFLVGWLFTADFPWHSAAAWVSLVAYLVYYWFMVFCAYTAIENEKL